MASPAPAGVIDGAAIEGVCAIELAGERLTLLPRRAIWWPARRALIVADVHLGKCQAYRASGVPIPRGVLDADLSQLAAIVAETGAARLIVLGDLIHAGIGLSPQVIDRVAAWRAALPAAVQLIPGNHDGDATRLPPSWNIELRERGALEGPFALHHEPAIDARGYVLCGHIHPAARVGPLRLPCFWLGEQTGVLPAFSIFTGSVVVRPEPHDRLYAVAENLVAPCHRGR
jgi:DNA ligase-associated metallophosphoesterase